MKYNQPYDQPSNPNASYIDGNPSAGIQGSIVPAASIEYPQRELMNLITACGLVGTNSDLSQLLESIKNVDVCNILKNSINHGTQNAWVAVVPPLPSGTNFPIGTALWFCPGQPSVTGGTTFSLNGSPPARVTLPDRSPLLDHDVPSGFTWVFMFWDGVVWQVLAGISRTPGSIVTLYANASWFVSAITGSDTLYDGTQPAISGSHGPFQTIQRAVNETTKYNMNGYAQFIYVADYTTGGSYAPVALPATNGSGTVYLIGNQATPANCPITAATQYYCAILQTAGQYGIEGFRLSTVGGGYDGLAVNGGKMQGYGSLQFGPCGRYHMSAGNGGNLILNGPPTNNTTIIEAGANAAAHFAAATGGSTGIWTPTFPAVNLNILGSVNITAFLSATYAGSFQGFYNSITGFANCHGKKYDSSMNGLIGTLTGGPAVIPGDVAGTTESGGQYQP